MLNETKKRTGILWLCIAVGALAGFTNGFLGAGGGIILLWALKWMSPKGDEESVRDNFAMTVAVILLFSTVSAVSYSHFSKVDSADPGSALLFFLPGAAGGVFGAYLTDRLDTRILKIAFGIIMLIAGINMVM